MQALQKALEMANFNNTKIIEETIEFLHNSAEDWWQILWAHGTRAKFEQLMPKQLSNLGENVINKVKIFEQENGLKEKLQVFYGIVRNSK